jgi:hypothetical protein
MFANCPFTRHAAFASIIGADRVLPNLSRGDLVKSFDQRSFRDPKPAPLRIGRQHRGDERTPRNEQVPASFPQSTFLPRAGNCSRSKHPIELTPTRLLRLSKNLPHDWKKQRRFLGFAA